MHLKTYILWKTEWEKYLYNLRSCPENRRKHALEKHLKKMHEIIEQNKWDCGTHSVQQ